MLKELFSSEVRILLLNIFLMNPDSEYYLRELAEKFNVSPRHISLELQNLKSVDLIKKRISGKQHYYSININHPIFHELQNIFIKTIGLKSVIENSLANFKEFIKFAFIYGSIAKGDVRANSDIDLMIIGDISGRKISSAMIHSGNKLNKEVNFNIFSFDEFSSRLKSNDHFINSIYKESKLFLIGDQNEFERLGKEWLA
jgi:predicted nucleotidyltransferase